MKGRARTTVKPAAFAYFDPATAEEVVETLGELGDKRATEPLVDAIKSDDPATRYYAARALIKLGDKRAIAPLERLYYSETREYIKNEIAVPLRNLKYGKP